MAWAWPVGMRDQRVGGERGGRPGGEFLERGGCTGSLMKVSRHNFIVT